MEKQIKQSIADRIKNEYRKHKDLEGWERIAAGKIFDNSKRYFEYYGFMSFAIKEGISKHFGGVISALLGVFIWTFDHSNIYNWIALYMFGYFIVGGFFDLLKLAVFLWTDKTKQNEP